MYSILYYKSFADITMNDLGNSISSVVDANICMAAPDGEILYLYERTQELGSEYYDRVMGNKDGLIKHIVQLNTTHIDLPLTSPFVLLTEGSERGLFSFFPVIVEAKYICNLILWHEEEPITDDELAICESACAMISMCIGRSRARENRLIRIQKDAARVAAGILSYSELHSIKELLKRMEGNECIIVISDLADEIYIARSIIAGALKKLESSDIINVRSLGVKGTHIRINNPYIYSAVNEANEKGLDIPPPKPKQFKL